MKVVTRFAPSPTGHIHLGCIKALLFPYLYAKKHNGHFILRIDNTDQLRSKEEYTKEIFDILKWLKIDYDSTFDQASQQQKYEKIFQILKEKQYIYSCSETPEELEHIKLIKRKQNKAPVIQKNDCKSNPERKEYWRFDLKKEKIMFKDMIFGQMEFSRTWSDPVIRKPTGEFTYTFCSVVDDILSGVTHIIRGEDHIPNGAIQKIIGDSICQELFGTDWNINFAHFSLFLDENGKKLSKRNLGHNFNQLQHFEPETFYAFVFNLGVKNFNLFSDIKDYYKNFNIQAYGHSKTKLNIKDLEVLNRKILQIKEIPKEENPKIWQLLISNCSTKKEYMDLKNNLYNFIKNQKNFPSVEPLIQKKISLEDFLGGFESKKLGYNFLYQNILKNSHGPRAQDLIDFIHSYK